VPLDLPSSATVLEYRGRADHFRGSLPLNHVISTKHTVCYWLRSNTANSSSSSSSPSLFSQPLLSSLVTPSSTLNDTSTKPSISRCENKSPATRPQASPASATPHPKPRCLGCDAAVSAGSRCDGDTHFVGRMKVA
jgi:hypothetical protein